MIIEHKPGCTWSSLPMDGAPTCQCGALAAAWNRRVTTTEPAPDAGEAKRITNLLIEEREARSREVRTLWDQIYWQRTELAAIRAALNGHADSNLASLAETLVTQRRQLAEALLDALPTVLTEDDIAPGTLRLAHSILADEPQPPPAGDGEREALRDAIEFAIQALEKEGDACVMRGDFYPEHLDEAETRLRAALARVAELEEALLHFRVAVDAQPFSAPMVDELADAYDRARELLEDNDE